MGLITVTLVFAIILKCQFAVGQLVYGPASAVLVHHDDDVGAVQAAEFADNIYHVPHDVHVPHSARVGILGGILAGQQHHTMELIERERQHHAKKNKCTANDKFKACCRQIDMTKDMTNLDKLINDACKYPPEERVMVNSYTLAQYYDEYVGCFTDGKDNRECCAKAGVPSKVSYAFWSANCQDLCHELSAKFRVNPAWDNCLAYRSRISKCNEAGVDLTTLTAVSVGGICKNETICKDPMGWKSVCKH